MATPNETGKLFEQFIVPPFTVLDTAQGYWQTRRKLWKSLGIESEIGRSENLTYNGKSDDFLSNKLSDAGTTSIFDPVLCELMYRWFSPNTGTILDPFCGGSVRGIVAGKLGRSYVGVDLRQEQVVENRNQLARVCPGSNVSYLCSDSLNIPTLEGVPDNVDLVFSCPPYGDLEVYSDDPKDLSNMDAEAFLGAYRKIIQHSVARLKPNRFAVFVVGNYRRNNGAMYDFTGDTIRAFEDAGANFYNQFILVNSVNTLCLRVGRQFVATRKAGMRHQSVVVCVKGDPKIATQELGPVDTVYPGGVFSKPEESSVLDMFE